MKKIIPQEVVWNIFVNKTNKMRGLRQYLTRDPIILKNSSKFLTLKHRELIT